MFTRRDIARAAFVILTLCALHVWSSYTFGEKAAKEAAHRISLIWPNILDLSTADRVLINNAAYYCDIQNEYPLPGAIKDCLRIGAMKMDAYQADAQSLKRLEVLLVSAN